MRQDPSQRAWIKQVARNCWIRMVFVVALGIWFDSYLGKYDHHIGALLFFCGLPLALYLVGVRSRTMSVATGIVLLILMYETGRNYQDALDNNSSTSGLAWFEFTGIGILAVGLSTLIETAASGRRQKHQPIPPPPSEPS